MHIEGFHRGPVACLAIRSEVFENIPSRDEAHHKGCHLRRLLLATGYNQHSGAGSLDNAPYAVQRSEGTLRFTSLGHNHTKARASLHVRRDVPLHVGQPEPEEQHAIFREVLEVLVLLRHECSMCKSGWDVH